MMQCILVMPNVSVMAPTLCFETGYKDLLKYMADNEIMVEINLTSSDALLGIKGSAHPYSVYKNAGVPISLSTDDEGVARIDLTHEYMRAVQELDVSYAELKEYTYNGLKYAFVGRGNQSGDD